MLLEALGSPRLDVRVPPELEREVVEWLAEAVKTLWLLHGVNLDMLGRRDPAHYGVLTLPELEAYVVETRRGARLRGALLTRPTTKASSSRRSTRSCATGPTP